jgi:hypothetical protein
MIYIIVFFLKYGAEQNGKYPLKFSPLVPWIQFMKDTTELGCKCKIPYRISNSKRTFGNWIFVFELL